MTITNEIYLVKIKLANFILETYPPQFSASSLHDIEASSGKVSYQKASLESVVS